jgi:thymidylate kinase
MYTGLINYIKTLEESEQILIFDRTFFTNEVYSRCGYKDYNFTKAYNELLSKFINLNFNIYFINLYLENTNIFAERLKRDSHHNYLEFSVENSIKQQDTYQQICDELDKKTNIKVLRIATDDYEKAYQEIRNNLPLL